MHLDQAEEDDPPGILVNVPAQLINIAMSRDLIRINQAELCRRLNRWAARVHFSKLRQGILEEPAHYC